MHVHVHWLTLFISTWIKLTWHQKDVQMWAVCKAVVRHGCDTLIGADWAAMLRHQNRVEFLPCDGDTKKLKWSHHIQQLKVWKDEASNFPSGSPLLD